jgi:hypothetical protein
LPAFCSFAVPARAQTSIAPGQSATLSGTDVGAEAEGGDLVCSTSCFLPEYLFSSVQPEDNFVRARFNDMVIFTGLALPHVATARIRNDFEIPGPPDSVVLVQISATYDLFVSLLGSAAYEAAGELSLVVEDVTSGTPVAVGSVSLFRQDRSGDQGFTDITTGREVYDMTAAAGQLQLELRRGRVYRVWFVAEVMGEQFVVGNSDVRTTATLRRLVVQVDEDEVEQLAVHDEEIKQQLATHDGDVKEQLTRIEGKIDALGEQLALIQRTQLEQTLVARDESRLTVLQTDRLEEVCEAASKAIEASGDLGYRVKQAAQKLLDEGLAAQASDPKRAVALCRDAYRTAAYKRKLE